MPFKFVIRARALAHLDASHTPRGAMTKSPHPAETNTNTQPPLPRAADAADGEARAAGVPPKTILARGRNTTGSHPLTRSLARRVVK